MCTVNVFVTSVLVFLPVTLIAGNWSIGGSVTPAVTLPQSSYALPAPSGRFNYSIGIFGMCDLSPDLFLKGSVQYTRRDVITSKGIPDTHDAMDPVTGRIDPSRIVYGDASQLFESFNLPITANLRIAQAGPVQIAIAGGIEVGFLFQQSFIIDPTTKGRWAHSDPDHGFIIGAIIGIAGRCNLSEDLTILLSPNYSYAWYPDASFGRIHFQAIAVELGVSCTL